MVLFCLCSLWWPRSVCYNVDQIRRGGVCRALEEGSVKAVWVSMMASFECYCGWEGGCRIGNVTHEWDYSRDAQSCYWRASFQWSLAPGLFKCLLEPANQGLHDNSKGVLELNVTLHNNSDFMGATGLIGFAICSFRLNKEAAKNEETKNKGCGVCLYSCQINLWLVHD